jgi:tRNA threonylcarbamoyladenosine biosynthesis protein TsaE
VVMATFISNTPEATLALGRTWGEAASAGLVIGLSGELGSGKTQLVKGIALGLGVRKRVTSPTFALVNEYREGRLALFHLDLYRLDTRDQVIQAGLEDYLVGPAGVTVVEWVERWLAPPTGSSGSMAYLPAGLAPEPGLTRLPDRLQDLNRWARAVLAQGARYRGVWVESLGESVRQISYEDVGA